MRQTSLICPVCNGLETIVKSCEKCSTKMKNKGPIEDFLGPYSAFEEQLIFEFQENKDAGKGFCWHLLVCENCLTQQIIPVTCIQSSFY